MWALITGKQSQDQIRDCEPVFGDFKDYEVLE
jgi:hypothetical protein